MPVSRQRAEEIVREEMKRHPSDAVFGGFNRRRTSFGSTTWMLIQGEPVGPASITLSGPGLDRQDEDGVRNTVLHEIAHALVGPGKGHGPEWKAAARRVGARPETRSQAVLAPTWADYKWAAQCMGCDKLVSGRHRLTDRQRRSRSFHVGCGPVLGRIRWIETATLANVR